MWWWWGDPWGTGHWIGIGFMTVFWIAVIVGLVFLIRHAASRSAASGKPPTNEGQAPSAGGGQAPTTGASAPEKGAGTGTSDQVNSEALRILGERYARGDIDREEFLQRKADLTS